MTVFLGFTVFPDFDIESRRIDEFVEDNANGDQISVWGGKQQWVFHFLILAGAQGDNPTRPTKADGGRMLATVRAHRAKHKYHVPFGWTVPQDLGLAVPAGVRRTVGENAAGEQTVTLTSASNVIVGHYFAFAGHRKIYTVTGINGSDVEFEPELEAVVPTNAALDFTPLGNFCWDRASLERYKYNRRGNLVAIGCSLREQTVAP